MCVDPALAQTFGEDSKLEFGFLLFVLLLNKVVVSCQSLLSTLARYTEENIRLKQKKINRLKLFFRTSLVLRAARWSARALLFHSGLLLGLGNHRHHHHLLLILLPADRRHARIDPALPIKLCNHQTTICCCWCSHLLLFLSFFIYFVSLLYRSYHSSYTLLQQHFWFLDTISKWRQTFSPSICSYFRLLPHSFFSARAGPLDVIGWWTYDAKPVPSTYLSHVWSRRCIVGRIV